MNGGRAKALRTVERPHPGRKHGGVNRQERGPVVHVVPWTDRELQWQKRGGS